MILSPGLARGCAALVFAAALVAAARLEAETWPSKRVQVVVPFSPGSATEAPIAIDLAKAAGIAAK